MIAILLMLAAVQDKPLDCRDPVSQSDMTQCAARDFAVADAELNVQWKKAVAAARARDKVDPAEKGRLGHADALLEAQRAWIAWRDAHCRAEGYAMRGGSAEPMIVHGCKASLTRDRTAQLHDGLEGH